MLVNSIGVVIPAYNAEKTIGTIIEQLIKYGFKPKNIIVVDDGSKDNTYSVAKRYDVQLIRSHNNMGKGAALNKGFDRAISMGLKMVFTLDADGQHQVSEFKRFLSAGEDSDIIIGKRLENSPEMPILRRIVNRVTSLVISLLGNCYIPDVQSGYRLINLAIFKKVKLKTKHFQTESELVLKAIKNKYRISFVPITTVYNSERSYIMPLIDTIRFINMAIRFLWA